MGTLGFSIVLPFMVFLVTKWGGNAIVYGVLASTYSLFQLIGAPILGKWSDRWGRRRILLLSQIGTMLSWVIFLAAFVLPDGALLVGASESLQGCLSKLRLNQCEGQFFYQCKPGEKS